jgi:hypothetical protein
MHRNMSIEVGVCMIRKIGLVLLLAALSGAASAGEGCKTQQCIGRHHHGSDPVAAPEIDPASAIAGLTLAMGGLAVLRGRRFKNKA